MKIKLFSILALLATVLCGVTCTKNPSTGNTHETEEEQHASPHAIPGSYEDWCGEHQVPESKCTRCNSKLIGAFKATGDWCSEHSLPESQCRTCKPDLKIERPSKTGESSSGKTAEAQAPTANSADESQGEHASAESKPGSYEDWCGEHQVPESMCTRCHPKLIAAFKATGDWCSEHGLPESQCRTCKPNLKIARPAKKEVIP